MAQEIIWFTMIESASKLEMQDTVIDIVRCGILDHPDDCFQPSLF